jgi:sulfite reductase (NADPH) flavoprotein alpha-component
MDNKVPLLPESAPFHGEQRAWINGYLAGLFSASTPVGAATAAASRGPLLFLFGSQTGGAEGLAKKFAREAKKAGFASRAAGLDEAIDLGKEERVCIVTSTYGDGEMPDNAQGFWDKLQNGSAPALGHLSFSVLALGDRNYTQFCEAGRLFDVRFEELGARRIHDRVDCDVDYETPATAWFDGLMAKLGSGSAQVPAAVKEAAAGFGKANPFPAVLKTNRVLNGSGSAKETRHFEIVLEGSGLTYEAGDALGVAPTNCPEFVQEILTAAGCDGEESVTGPDGGEMPLRLALLQKFDLKPFLVSPPQGGVAARELVAPLRKLPPRLYSISSSPKAHPGEVHLTVAVVRYEVDGRRRKGVCSTFLADRVSGDGRVPVFVHTSPHFRLPADPSRPVLMVGPGTGIAPFRAFLEERRAIGAPGKNWLFFGDQRAATDFLYREELEQMGKDGFLTRVDLAFSRDQAEKIYVQDRLREHAGEVWAWLQDGAFFYVCGDAQRMAKDVDTALHEVAQKAGGLSAEAAADYIKQLKSEKRYLRDVY